MNVLTILRSVEELLYEVMSWLLFYPRTLVMTLRHPLRTMRYSDSEQRDKPDKQYLETLSPPLFLVLSILLAHGIELAAGFGVERHASEVSRLITASDQNLLIFRALMFSLHPLVFAWAWLKLSGHKVDRDTLRPPFFAQCYLSGATSILVSLGSMGVRDTALWTTVAGVVVVLAATGWYIGIQRLWLMGVPGMTQGKAWAWAAGLFVATTGLVVLGNALVE
ncbi:hypothetical protein GCM10009422_17470 [Brevundimonas kwangchunensis]|uniref:Permease n=1 Tax=Brevundimonas kwangchunensis TaxID=322163 RepID=A0ABP3S080_9CAUL